MRTTIRLGTLGLLIAGSTFLASCTSKITDQQLKELTDLRNRERTLRSQIEAKRTDLSNVQREVADQQKLVDRCAQDRQFVDTKLKQWPNVGWPDNWAPGTSTGGTQ